MLSLRILLCLSVMWSDFTTIMFNACIQPDPGNSGGAADSQQPDLAEFVSSVCWRKVWPHTPLMHTPCHGTHLLHVQNTRTILAANSQGHIKVNSCMSYPVGCQPMNTSLYCRCWRWPLRLEPPAVTVCSIYIVFYILLLFYYYFVEFYCQKVSNWFLLHVHVHVQPFRATTHVRLGTRFSLLLHTASNGKLGGAWEWGYLMYRVICIACTLLYFNNEFS